MLKTKKQSRNNQKEHIGKLDPSDSVSCISLVTLSLPDYIYYKCVYAVQAVASLDLNLKIQSGNCFL